MATKKSEATPSAATPATFTEQYKVNKRYDNDNGSKVYATCMNNKRLPSLLLTSDEVGMANLPEFGEGFILEHTGKRQLTGSKGGINLVVSNPKVSGRTVLAAPVSTVSEFDEAAYLASLDEVEY